MAHYETNCFPNLAVSKITKNSIYMNILHLHSTQFCIILYKDHPDVYRFFIITKLLNGEVLIGCRWTLNH